MTLESIIRTVVLKTNPYWPFSRLNRLPYRLAIRSFTRACREFPEIRSVYLRHALIDGQWTPALSDIDLSIIVDKDLTPEQLYSFLQRLWKRLGRLQSRFPMIGEVEILSEHHLESWRKFRIEGSEAVNWQLLAGEERVIGEYRPSPERFEREAFDYAFWFYLQNVKDLYGRKDNTTYLRRQDLMRLQRKIERCLAAMEPGNLPSEREPGSESFEAKVIVDLIARLERGLAQLELPAGFDPPATRRTPETRKPESKGERAVPGPELEEFADDIESVYLVHQDEAFVILRDDAESTAKTRCVNAVRDLMEHRDINTLFFSPGLFVYMLRHLRPCDYAWWSSQARLVFGNDLLAGIAPPSPSAFGLDLLAYAPVLLMLPQSRGTADSTGTGGLSSGELEWNLRRAIALKHLLLGAEAPRSMEELPADWTETDPDAMSVMNSLETGSGERLTEADRFDWFVVMRNLLEDVHEALSRNDDWESIGDADRASGASQSLIDRTDTNEKLVSAIVPVYNGERFLADAIESILEQPYDSIEIIVVDDGSTDGTARIAQSFGEKVRYVHQQNGGPSAARNAGLEIARGKYIAFLDSDDLWPPGKLESAMNVLETDPRVDAVIGRSRFLQVTDENGAAGPSQEVLEPRVFLQVGSLVIRRSMFEKAGLFDTTLDYSEDIDWILRARDLGMRLETVNEVSLLHRLHGENMTRAVAQNQLQLARVLKRSLDRRRRS